MYLQTIHAYMTFLCERSKGRCLFVQSGFIDQVRRRKYDAAKRWLGRSTVTIFGNKDHSVGVTQMFFPINLNNQHRLLGVVDLRKKQSSVLDSLAGDHSRRIEVIRFIIFYPPPSFSLNNKKTKTKFDDINPRIFLGCFRVSQIGFVVVFFNVTRERERNCGRFLCASATTCSKTIQRQRLWYFLLYVRRFSQSRSCSLFSRSPICLDSERTSHLI